MRTFKVITAAAAIAALAGGTAAAQQTPTDDGTNANGPITIFKNMQVEPAGMRVAIDGHEVDHLRSASYDDITSVVHSGTNTMTVTWSGPVPGTTLARPEELACGTAFPLMATI